MGYLNLNKNWELNIFSIYLFTMGCLNLNKSGNWIFSPFIYFNYFILIHPNAHYDKWQIVHYYLAYIEMQVSTLVFRQWAILISYSLSGIIMGFWGHLWCIDSLVSSFLLIFLYFCEIQYISIGCLAQKFFLRHVDAMMIVCISFWPQWDLSYIGYNVKRVTPSFYWVLDSFCKFL